MGLSSSVFQSILSKLGIDNCIHQLEGKRGKECIIRSQVRRFSIYQFPSFPIL